MKSISLSNRTRNVIWYIFAVLCSLLLITQLFGAMVKRLTTSSGSTACGRTVSQSTSQYSSYLETAVLAPDFRNRVAAATTEDDGLSTVELQSDILLYPAVIIAADGHKVKITGQTTYQAGSSAMTKVWVDENDNGIEEESECIEELSSFMSSVYLYGGSDSLATTCNSISITMEGGEIGAIFAGGYYQNVTTQSVDIKILGGSVHYVDCGSHVGPLNESLTAGSISVLLQDCRYRSNFPVSFLNKNSYKCNDVTVRDLADHRNRQSYTWVKPVFNNYISQISKNRYIFGGHVTIPADRSIKAEKLVLEGAEVNNLGTVAISSCADIHMLDSAIWRGNDIETTHSEGSVVSYDYKSHTRQCSICGQNICRDHIWTYPISDGKTHVKQCTICQYNYTENCTKKTMYNHGLIKKDMCVYCGNYSGFAKDDQTNTFDPDCEHSARTYTTITRYHADLLPDTLVEYSINHKAYYCPNGSCKAMLPFSINYNSNYYYFRGLTEVSQFIKKNSISTAYVNMNCDAFDQTDRATLDSVYTSGTITLNMNGCDMMAGRKLILHSGTINIQNTKFNTNHYAKLAWQNMVSSSNATVTINGCYLANLTVDDSSATFKLTNVALGSLYVENRSKLATLSNVIVEDYLHLNSSYTKSFLPTGSILKECLGNGAWIRRYDHTDELPTDMGPASEYSGSVAIMPCALHKLTSATKTSTTMHRGTCSYCKSTVYLSHDYTCGTDANDNENHEAKCSLCSYSDATMLRSHDYGADGICSVEGCGHVAPVSVHGHYSASKAYFNSFNDAFAVANAAGLYDTITMYTDQTNTLDVELDTVRVKLRFSRLGASQMILNTQILSGPHIHVAAGKNTLSNSGSIKKPAISSGTLYYGFDISGDTAKYQYNSTNFPIAAAPGYVFQRGVSIGTKPAYRRVFPCQHTSVTHAQVTDTGGNVMAYHSRTCDNCGQTWYWDHEYTDGVCDTCSVLEDNTIAARVTWPGMQKPETFPTLKAAWTYAYRYSHLYNKICTIQVLKDISLKSESTTKDSLFISSSYPNADIVLDATDDAGKERYIYGWYQTGRRNGKLYFSDYAGSIIYLERGHLTIKSGIFRGCKYGVYTTKRDYLTIEGGTFLNGYSASENDGVYCKNGAPTCLAPGYAIVTKADGTNVRANQTYGPYRKGRYYPSSNSLVFGANGEVIPCPHPYGELSDYIAPTCYSTGSPQYIYCPSCNLYLDMQTGTLLEDAPTIEKLTHSFDANYDCKYCGVHRSGVIYRKYNSSGTMTSGSYVTSFIDAWRMVADDSKTAADGSTYSLTLYADEDVAPNTDYLLTSSPKFNVTINLNGHNLNLGDERLYMTPNLIIKDSSKKGSLTCGTVYMPNDTSVLTLDGVQLKTGDLYSMNLDMKNGAGVHFDGGTKDDAIIHLKNVTMENGCSMEGDGCSSFDLDGIKKGSSYDWDLEEAIVDMNHNLEIEQQDCHGNWIEAVGTKNYFNFQNEDANGKRSVVVKNKVSSSLVNNASTCYRWRAVKEDVEHTFASSGRYCSYCAFYTQHYMLIDRYTYSGSQDVEYKGVAYTRNFSTPNVWEAMYVPMSLDVESCKDVCDIADIYSFGRMCDTDGDGQLTEADDTWLIVDKMTSGTTDANYPYLVRAKQNGDIKMVSSDGFLSKAASCNFSCSNSHTTYTFYGTNARKTITQADTYFALDNQGVMQVAAKSSYVYPQRWYMRPTANGSGYATALKSAQANGIRVMVIGEDLTEETAIQLLQGESVYVWQNGERYTLDGRKATTTQSGLQIVNGKKIITK